MTSDQILTVIAVLFTAGGFYYSTNHRLKALEKRIESTGDLKEIITRLDERVTLLINHFIKDKI